MRTILDQGVVEEAVATGKNRCSNNMCQDKSSNRYNSNQCVFKERGQLSQEEDSFKEQ